MNLKLINKEEKPLVAHTYVKFDVTYNGKTPTRNDLKKEIAKSLNSKEELISIKKIHNSYGYSKATIEALVYFDKKKLDELEPKWVAQRSLSKSEKKAKEVKKE